MAESSLAGWSRTFVADGLLFTHPNGARDGSIRIRSKVRPLVSTATMLELMRSQVPALYSNVNVEKPVRVSTNDGEYAFILQLTASEGERAFQRTLAMILGDDFFDTIDGVSTIRREFDDGLHLIEGLLYCYALGLGERRRRRYFYRLPEGWSGIERPHATMWIPPDFPRNKAGITVFDARPTAITPSSVQDRALWEDLPASFQQDERKPTFDMTNMHDLTGRVVILSGRYPDGPRETIHNVAMFDERWVYFVRLECTDEHLEKNRLALGTIVESIEPLPAARSPSSLIRWAENWAE